MIEWHIEKRKISELKDYEKNPRRLTKEQAEHLKRSLEKFGLAERPIINLDNTIIGGHQRRSILKKMGIKEVECNVPNRMLDDNEVQEFNIRLNRGASWDWDILANAYEVTDLVDYGFQLSELLGDIDKLTEESPKEDGACKCPTCGKKMKKN